MKILIADDDGAVRKMILKILVSAGYQGDEASDAEKLLQLWKEHRHMLIISDIEMPGKNGIQVCLEIKKSAPDMRFILMSGSPELLDKAMAAGFIHLLGKPFTISEFMEKLDEAAVGFREKRNFSSADNRSL